MTIEIWTQQQMITQGSKGLLLVDFYADWCGPCRMQVPVLEEIAEKHPSIKVVKINTEEAMDLTSRLEVTSLPTLALFKDGKEVCREVGLQDVDGIEKMLAEVND